MGTRCKANSTNLYSSYREINQAQGLNLSQTLALINKELGLNITHSRYAQWESGQRSPSKQVINFILMQVLQVKCAGLNLSPTQTQAFMQSLKIA